MKIVNIRQILLCAAIVAGLHAFAAHPREEIAADKRLSAANFMVYPEPEGVRLTKAPKGYKPFHISTYARHGSRFHTGAWVYTDAMRPLLKADSAGVLSEAGRDALARIVRVEEMSRGRIGELTAEGARQHRGIARRMYRNFPEVFAGDASVDARSTDVIRCILSMTAQTNALQGENPKLRISNDASRHDMYYMNDWQNDHKYDRDLYGTVIDSLLGDHKRRHLDPGRLMGQLFTDVAWVEANIPDTRRLMWDLFYVTVNMQSHSDQSLDLYWLFTPEECYRLWTCNNVEWYLKAGNTPLTGYDMQYKQANLLTNILDMADECVASRKRGATMRFGHESCVIPTVVLMELGDYAYESDDLETLSEHWVDYRIFPMACNIQLVFYAKDGSDDVLVRALLNEHEVTLPVESDCAPFYRWSDVSRYYRAKLASRNK